MLVSLDLYESLCLSDDGALVPALPAPRASAASTTVPIVADIDDAGSSATSYVDLPADEGAEQSRRPLVRLPHRPSGQRGGERRSWRRGLAHPFR